jgi:hypothetical protein
MRRDKDKRRDNVKRIDKDKRRDKDKRLSIGTRVGLSYFRFVVFIIVYTRLVSLYLLPRQE